MDSRTKKAAPDPELDAQHARVFDLLGEYASALLLSPPPGPECHELESHIARCPRCAQELAELRRTLSDELTGGAQSKTYPKPDLSFLPTAAPSAYRNGITPPSSIAPAMRSMRIEFSAALVAGLRPARLLGSLRNGAAGPPGNGNRPPPPAGWNYQVSGASESELSVMIEIEPLGNDGQLCRVLITVDDPTDPLPQRESTVTLHYDYITRNADTDRGTVSFNNVPLAVVTQLRVTVTKPSSA